MSSNERTQVLIVGGGYAGLAASLFLTWRGIPSVLVERHPSTSVQPKAFGINQRSMELLGTVPGFAQEIHDAEVMNFGQEASIMIASSLSDPDPHVIMGGEEGEENRDFSLLDTKTPARFGGVAQAQAEELLRNKAEKVGADLRFGTELVSFSSGIDEVTAVVRDLATGQEHSIMADYLIAADGWRAPIREQLGIPVAGRGVLSHMQAILFDADLGDLLQGRESILCFLQRPDFGGVFTYSGFSGTGRDGEYLLAVNFSPEEGQSPDDFTEERCHELIRLAVGVPDVQSALVSSSTFTVAHQAAIGFSFGRVFFAGDAAHVMPPTGGMGGNTALQDGYDLAWRMAAVLNGHAGPQLLDSYDSERRPVCEHTIDQQLIDFSARMAPQMREGLPEQVPYMWQYMGYRYHSATIATEPEDDRSLIEDPFEAEARPGSRAPYIELDTEEGRTSTTELFGRDFVLLAGPDGAAWEQAFGEAAEEMGIPLTAYRIGAEIKDVNEDWAEAYGVDEAGAVLVRPDFYVAWRSKTGGADVQDRSRAALRRALARGDG